MRSFLGALRGGPAGGGDTRADTPVPYTHRYAGSGGIPALAPGGTEAYLRAMGRTGILFAIAGGLAQDVSQVGWTLYRKPRTPGADRVEVSSHAAVDLWAKPNPFMPRQEFVETFQQHAELVGEAWWVLYKPGRLTYPVEMWPVRPDRMEAIPHPEKFLTGYAYRGPGGEEIPLRLDEVIQIRQPDPVDIYRGMGAVQTVLPNLETDRMSAEWLRNFFVNSAQPGGLIKVDRRLSDDEFYEMKLRWEEQHRGVARAHRVAILEQAEWVDRRYSMRDMEFSANTKVNDDKIRQAYRYPVPLLGTVEAVNLANNLAQQEAYARYLLMIRLARVKAALNFDLLPMYGDTTDGLEFDHDNPVPEDRAAADAERDSKVKAADILIKLGFDPAEVLAALELPPMKITAAPPPPAPAAVPAQGTQPPAPLEAARLELALAALGGPHAAIPSAHTTNGHGGHGRAPSSRAGDGEDGGEPDLAGVRTDLEDATGALEADWVPVLDSQIDSIVSQVAEAVDADDMEALTSVTVPDGILGVDVLRGALGGMARTAAKRAADELAAQGVKIEVPEFNDEGDFPSEFRAAGLLDFGAELVEIARVTAHLLASGLASAAVREALRLWTPGAVGADVGRRVRKFLGDLKGGDRRVTFGGVLHRAVNMGRFAAFGVAMKVRRGAKIRASERNDANTCAPCSEVDERVFDSLAEAFESYGSGGYRDCLGRDRCRGTAHLYWPGRGGD